MCDLCQHLGSLTIPHKEVECPYQASLYCVACGCYGHRRKQCPTKELHIRDDYEEIKKWVKEHGLNHHGQIHQMKKQMITAAYLLKPPHRVVFLPKR